MPRIRQGFLRLAALSAAAVCLALPLLASGAPLRWRWSNPRPHGGNVVDMAYSSLAGVAIQVAERGQVFSSADLDAWIPQPTGTSNDMRAVTFFGARILITGENGRVLYGDSPGALTHGVVDPPTTDWLEAVTSSLQLAVAVGDTGAVYTSTNGVYWKRQNSGTTVWLRGVAFGNGGFVAVGENGKIISSLNGTNWTSRASGVTVPFNRVVYSAGHYTAVAEDGVCRFSTNAALNWQGEITGAVNDLFHSANNDQARLAVGDSEVRLQETGGLWTDQLANPDGPLAWTYYANVARPGYFLIAGRTGLMEEAYKTNSNPFTWLPLEGSPRNWLWDITNPSNLYVAVGDRATVMTSANGGEWKVELVPPEATNSIFLGISGNTNLLVAAGNQGSLIISPNVVTNLTITNIVNGVPVPTNVTGSAFGVIWHAIPLPTTNDLQGVHVSSNLVVVTGGGGTILTSPDGTNWTLRASPTALALTSVTASPQGWVATGDDGAILVSPDAETWSVVPALTTNWLYRVRHLNGSLVAVGQNGTILTSTNGTLWMKRTSGTTKWLNDVVWVDGTWFVVGNSGTVLTSTNLIDWLNVGTITRKNLYGASTDGRQLITVGLEGSILRVQIAPDLTPVRILSYDRVVSTNELGGTLTQNLYLFGGQPDQSFTLDYLPFVETNLWITGPTLDFYDGSATLFYLETFTTTNLPPGEFYRATLLLP